MFVHKRISYKITLNDLEFEILYRILTAKTAFRTFFPHGFIHGGLKVDHDAVSKFLDVIHDKMSEAATNQ